MGVSNKGFVWKKEDGGGGLTISSKLHLILGLIARRTEIRRKKERVKGSKPSPIQWDLWFGLKDS